MLRFKGGLQKLLSITNNTRGIQYQFEYARLCQAQSQFKFSTDNSKSGGSGGIQGDYPKGGQNQFPNKFFNKQQRKTQASNPQNEGGRPPRGSQPPHDTGRGSYQPRNSGGGSNYQGGQSSRYQTSKQNENYQNPKSAKDPDSKGNIVEQIFLQRFGKNKSELLDSWLEMDGADLVKECDRMGVTPSSKHIENIQNLFEQLKKIEAEIEAEGAQQNPASSQGSQQAQIKSQSPESLFRKPPRIDKPNASSTPQGGGGQGQTGGFGQQQSSPRSFMVDQEKARENLNEQLARILNKRKTTKTSTLFSDQQSQAQDQQDSRGAKIFKTPQAAEVAFQQKEQSTAIENPFQFNLNALKNQVIERGPIVNEASASATFQYTHTDSALIDRIFDMTSEQLDGHFKSYTDAEKASQIFQQMDLRTDEFEKMPSITKKKVLINMTGLRQTITSDPNTSVSESRHNSLKSLVNFTHENLLFLNNQSKGLLAEQLQQMLKNADSSQRGTLSVLFNNPSLQLELIKVSQNLLDKDSQQAVKNQLVKICQSEYDSMQELSLDNALLYSKVLLYLSKDNKQSNQIVKLQSQFQNVIKKSLQRKSLKTLSFQQQLQLLDVMPPSTETDPNQIQKSLQYQLLNEMVAPSPSLVSKWESLDKDQVLRIVGRCMEISKARDINNKLRGCLNYISTQQFSLTDFHKLFKMLSETHGLQQHTGQVDVKLVSGLLMRRNLKTAANLVNSADAKELKKYFDFYDFLYKQNPVSFAFVPHELKMLVTRASQLAQEQHLPLQEMVAFSKTMVPSMYKPVIFFAEMITNTRESFKSDVNHADLYELVEQALKRAQDGEVGFEHLQLSTSRVHRNYRPYTEKTIFLLRRILNDIIGDGIQTINDLEMRIVSKIFSDPKLTEFLYKTSADVERQLKPILSSMTFSLQNKLSQHSKSSNSTSDTTTYPENFTIDFNQWIEHFEALSSISLLLDARNSALLPQQSALASLKETLLSDVAPLSFTVLKHELFKTSTFTPVSSSSISTATSPLDSIFKLNKSLLAFFDHAGFQESLYQDSQVRELVTTILEQYFLNKKPFVLSFEKFKKNIKISKVIQVDTNKTLITNNIKEIVHFLNYAQNLEGAKDIAREVCKLMLPLSRSIVGNDLINLFKMIDRFGITEDVRQLMINVAPNLMTIESQNIYQFEGANNGPKQDMQNDVHFTRINERLKKSDLANKIMILKKYESIYHHQPELLKRPEASLSPLSYLMAEVFDEYQDDQVQMCLEILGNEKVDNYHEEFIKRLYERYSQPSVIDNMANANQRFFLRFAKHWPHFLKNNALLNQLISLGRQSSTLVKQQSETLHILTRKNVLHPELLEAHLETFMKMKDRERVAEYLQEFLHSCAVLGYTELKPGDVHKITQLIRRLYKTPDQIPNISQLLDYFIVLALSNNVYFKDFDDKSVEFVEAGISLIEKRFTGSECLEVPLLDPITGEKVLNSESDEQEKVRLSYFKSIPSQNKIYNKVLVPNNQYTRKLNFGKTERDLQALANMEQIVTSSDDEEATVQAEDKKEEVVDTESATIKKVLPLSSASSRKDKYKEKRFTEDDDAPADIFNDDPEALVTPPPDFIINEDIDAEMHEAVKKQHANEKGGQAGIPINQKNVKEKKIYERKASESLYSEELEFHQFRKKKLQDLDKKSKHLLLFSNINQLNFVDVNQNETVKAWAVLFHFRSKTFDSIIYDEFESITMRNAIGKSKGHELFSKFYLKLIEASYDKGFRMHLTTKCEKTGWPIDISLNTAGQSPMDTGTSFNSASSQQRRKLALYFFLQEEVCLNAREQAEEPLGLQKLMLKHLQNISDFKVEYVTENDFYMNKDTIEGFVEYLLSEKLLNNQKSQSSSY